VYLWKYPNLASFQMYTSLQLFFRVSKNSWSSWASGSWSSFGKVGHK
jgi:hypothetical protein